MSGSELFNHVLPGSKYNSDDGPTLKEFEVDLGDRVVLVYSENQRDAEKVAKFRNEMLIPLKVKK